MRRFSADYLADTRHGMWADDRSALAPLSLADRERALDVGCGTGAFTSVLREECPGAVVGSDADPALLADVPPPRVVGDALRLPFPDDTFDLVACQALLVNLPDPARAVREFARVSRDAVACVEPDNAQVAVESTVGAEAPLARSAREAYAAGVPSDVSLGDASDLFADVGLSDVETAVYHRTRVTEPPYTERDVESARRKVRATRIDAARETLLAGSLSDDAYEALREEWRSMGRSVVEQMREERYRRAEVVPFYVTVGRVRDPSP